MTLVTEMDLPSVDLMDATLTGERFHAEMESLRERAWIARAEPAGFLVLDREAVAFFVRTPSATFPGRLMLELQGVREGPLYERMTGNLLDRDGDDHRRLRKLVQPAFTPPAADRHRPTMRAVLEELWGAVADEGRCDFVASFAKPYPSRMIAAVMGAPQEDAARLAEWANTIQAQFDPVRVASELHVLDRAAEEFQEYARELIAGAKPGAADDLLSELLSLEQDGERLSEQDCLDIVSSVLVGGVDTTQAQLTHAIRLFAEHPEQWRRVAADPSLAPGAVEEVLRYEPITPMTARITREDVEHRDVLFPRGTILLAASVTANRDPAEYDRPGEFDIHAERGRAKPLTFGAGPHFCLGANLARAELQEALAFLAPRMRDLELDGEPEYDTPLGVYGVRSLPVRFKAGSATA